MDGFVALEGKVLRRSLVDDETVFHQLAAILNILLQLVVVGLDLFYSPRSLALFFDILLKVFVSLRHGGIFLGLLLDIVETLARNLSLQFFTGRPGQAQSIFFVGFVFFLCILVIRIFFGIVQL